MRTQPLLIVPLLFLHRLLPAQPACDTCWSNVANWQGTYTLTVVGSGTEGDTSWMINTSSQASFWITNGVHAVHGSGTVNFSSTTPAPPMCTEGCNVSATSALDSMGRVGVKLDLPNCRYTLTISDLFSAVTTYTGCSSLTTTGFVGPSCGLATPIGTGLGVLPYFPLPAFGQPLAGSQTFTASQAAGGCGGGQGGQSTLTLTWNIVPADTILNVTKMSQGDSQWGSDPYDNSGTNIATLGCALTSLTMAMNQAGKSIDPGTLNTLMEISTFGVVNDFKGRSVNWASAVAHATLNPDGTSSIKFHPFRERGTCRLSQALAQGHPVIVAVNNAGHFVLVTGQQNGKFLINDPGHADRTTLDDPHYNNTFETRGYVSDPPGDLSTLNIAVDDAADIMVTDPLQRRTGFTPATGTLEEIPQSAYFVDRLESDNATGAPGNEAAHMVPIVQPLQGSYRIQLTGTNSGTYALTLGSTGTNGTFQPPLLLQGNTAPGLITTYNVILGPSGVTLTSPTPPVFQQTSRTNNLIWFTWTSNPGSTYQLQRATGLSNPIWMAVGSPVQATTTTTTASDPIGPESERFYRVALSP